MGCDLHPVVLQHIFQGVVAGQGSESPLPCKIFYTVAFYIIHPVFFKCLILYLQYLIFPCDLEQEKFFFEVLKREVVQLENSKVPLNEPGVFIWL